MNQLIRTVLEMQPRQSSGNSAKANDQTVYELAESILQRVAEKLDMDAAKQDMFIVSSLLTAEILSRTLDVI
jgi:dynein heavy chain